MRWFRFILVLTVITVLDASSILQMIATPQLRICPDLLLIAMVFFAANCSATEAIITSFMICFASDISIELHTMGPAIISFTLLGSMIGQLRKVVYQSMTIFAVGIITGTITFLLAYVKVNELQPNILIIVPGIALYSAVAGPVVWFFLNGMSQWLGIRQYPYGPMSSR